MLFGVELICILEYVASVKQYDQQITLYTNTKFIYFTTSQLFEPSAIFSATMKLFKTIKYLADNNGNT